MKKLLAISLLCLSSGLYAGTSNVNLGSSMTTGPSSNHFSIQAGFNNPAMASLLIGNDERWRFSYFPNFAVNFEIGSVDNFTEELDELIDIIDDRSSTDLTDEEILDRFNGFLSSVGDDGYLKANVGLDAPLLPLLYRSKGSTSAFGIGVRFATQVSGEILDDEITIDPINGSVLTSTSIYLKAGVEQRLSFVYSRELFSSKKASSGNLYAGAKLNIINLELSKQVTPLTILDGEDVADFIEDEFDNNLESTTNIGIDLGVVWDARNYRVGLTLENLNSPEFDYGEIGVNCGSITDISARSSCDAAAFFIQETGEIRARETHTMHTLLRADGLLKLSNRWFLSGAVDLAAYDDFTGFENQWLNLSTSFDPKKVWLPGTRLGYQKNLAGTELSSALLGFTFFKVLTLDFEYGLEDVIVDGSSTPRRFGFALGLEEHF